MRKTGLLLALLLPLWSISQDITTVFERSQAQETPTYQQIVDWWTLMARRFPQIHLRTMGLTDAGYPLHLVTLSNDKDTVFDHFHQQNKIVLMINNGIHPGEPDGIDASMLLVKDIVTGRLHLPDNVVLALIPVYNIGGCLDRSTFFRINQNGPNAFGFRGNGQNLDLNRDFIKSDSKNARAFAEIFHLCNPDILVDNHVSNGADYQHIITLLSSQHDKLGGSMGNYLHDQLEPGIYALMKQKGIDLVPYVNFFGETPEVGWSEFFDGPRYSSGYATLWHTFAFMPETHMLKTYQQRVEATYALMQSFIEFAATHAQAIRQARQQARQEALTRDSIPINWALDKTQYSEILFKGYEAGHKPSVISGQPRLYYDRSKPFEKNIRFYNTYNTTQSVSRPIAYIIPQGWWPVIERLKANQVILQPLAHDTVITVQVYHIDHFESAPRPYEGHHPNSQVTVTTTLEQQAFRKGDYYIPMNQEASRFLAEVLEPQAADSYFAWNFFDPILAQKEGYSHYVFEESAVEILKDHPEIKKALEEKKATDSAFATNGRAQLDLIYRLSPYFEPAYMRYPVYRVVE